MNRFESVTASRLLQMLPYLEYRNAKGAHIYTRPTGESPYTLLDDLTPAALSRLAAEGYSPAAVVENSPGSFQAWLRHPQPLSKELATLAAKTLAEQFGADRSAADWRRFGRAPGFTNRKPKHRTAQALYPFARLISHTGQPFPAAAPFLSSLTVLHQKAEQERATARLSFAASSRGHGFLHCRLRSRLVAVRHHRRIVMQLPRPQRQPHPPSRLHPPHTRKSPSMGRLGLVYGFGSGPAAPRPARQRPFHPLHSSLSLKARTQRAQRAGRQKTFRKCYETPPI